MPCGAEVPASVTEAISSVFFTYRRRPPPLAMSNLLRLIYVSRSTGAVDKPSLEGLLGQARARNEALGVTGVLCSGRGYFVQALEGPESNVLTVYASILKDGRHRDSALLNIGLTAMRAFSQWSMAHVDGESLSGELHSRLISQVLVDRDLSEPMRLLRGALKAVRRAA